MRDPYDVLGVTRQASDAEIKKAFRRLAKTWHPDQKPDDPKAKERFAEIGAAYELLSDKDKRAQFDRGEIDAEGKPRFHSFESAGAGARGAGARGAHFDFEFGGGSPFGGARGGRAGTEDIFEDILGAFGGRRPPRGGAGFGGGEPPRGEDVTAEIAVPFREWALGAKRRVRLPTGKELEIAVPAGIESGKTIRLKGQGKPSGLGGRPGDALVAVRVLPDPQFRAEGRDVRVTAPITLYEAVLGAKVRIPTLDGTVELTVPPGSDGTRTLRLRGKGVGADGAAGDLLVELRIALPKGGDRELEAFARKMRDEGAYDPRS
ncbi:DnaJ C-terminal domain-containing protein [Methylopila turkensis]|uniref:Molecular chaperone DnaJ n=1 Tax=Methylopila turkensis TaxID=1437816 RepID=A0A9W6N645_9HYPH|nr:DnaJ C-terminal domain-containing protein [Methylopila turkensis]GLK79839.1 molecular chaperone DnaJ [Methylopila turkensis]